MLSRLHRIVLRVLFLVTVVVTGLAGDVHARDLGDTAAIETSEQSSQSDDDGMGGAEEPSPDDEASSDDVSPGRDVATLMLYQSGRASFHAEVLSAWWVHLDRSPRPPRG